MIKTRTQHSAYKCTIAAELSAQIPQGIYIENIDPKLPIHDGQCWLRLAYRRHHSSPKMAAVTEIWILLERPTVKQVKHASIHYARAVGLYQHFPEILSLLPVEHEGLPAFDLDYGT